MTQTFPVHKDLAAQDSVALSCSLCTHSSKAEPLGDPTFPTQSPHSEVELGSDMSYGIHLLASAIYTLIPCPSEDITTLTKPKSKPSYGPSFW